MSRKMTIKAATLAAALGAMTSAAWAEPMKLTDAQMDQVAAGTWTPIEAKWIPYLGSYLYQYPGVVWVDPNKVPPPSAPPGSPGPTAGTPLPGGWTLIQPQWVPYNGSYLYLYSGSIWVNSNKVAPPGAPPGKS